MVAICLGLRWAVGLILISAGSTKFGGSMQSTVRNYGLVPERLIPFVAGSVPTIELTIGAILLVGIWPLVGAVAAAAMFSIFAVAIAWNLLQGHEFDCGCGFGRETPVSWKLVARNICFVTGAIVVVLGPSYGLAVLPGASLTHGAHVSSSSLVAVPMVVLLLGVAVRLASTLVAVTRADGVTEVGG